MFKDHMLLEHIASRSKYAPNHNHFGTCSGKEQSNVLKVLQEDLPQVSHRESINIDRVQLQTSTWKFDTRVVNLIKMMHRLCDCRVAR